MSTEALAQKLESIKPAELPQPPGAAIRIMRACVQAEIDSQHIGQIAAADPVLTAELLRIVNSAFYGLARKVDSIPHSISLLGRRSVRNLALCLAVKNTLRDKPVSALPAADFWEACVWRAAAAKLLAHRLGLDQDAAFTAGLIQDFGLLVLYHLRPSQAPKWERIARLDPAARRLIEQTDFGETHDRVMAKLAQQWDLPEDLSLALANHHVAHNSGAPKGLADILLAADWLAAQHKAPNKNLAATAAWQVCEGRLALTIQQFSEIQEQLPNLVAESAAILGFSLSDRAEIAAVTERAKQQLVEENLAYQELTLRLQATLKARDALTQARDADLALAREVQQALLAKTHPKLPVWAINLPALELSGDFYDYFEADGDRLFFNLADVSGKGVNAALLMVKASSVFRCLAKRGIPLTELMNALNQELCETAVRGMFVTAIAGVMDRGTREIQLINAGHQPAVHLQASGGLNVIGAQNAPLGIDQQTLYRPLSLKLEGGSLVLFSDGLAEQFHTAQDATGLHALVAKLAQLGPNASAAQLAEFAEQARHGAKTHDDITMLVLEGAHDRL